MFKNKRHALEFSQFIPRPIHEVFQFFGDEKNLERITPPWLHFQVLENNRGPLKAGSIIDYKLKVHGIPLKWRSKIDEWVPGVRFVDTQVIGPYRYWHHTHEFTESGNGTLMRDLIKYEVPNVPFGDLLLNPFIAKDLATIFSYRKTKIEEIFG